MALRHGFRASHACALMAACAAAGCSSEAKAPPTRLLNGARATPPPVRMDAPSPQIMTAVSTIAARRAASRAPAGDCARIASGQPPTGPVVVRTGTVGMSVSFRTSSGRALYACDASAPTTAGRTSFCGSAYGRLEHGRLHDPRLDLAACRTAEGDGIGFAWVEPRPKAAYVAVRQNGYTEVYPVRSATAVRVTTLDVDPDASGATFELSEHAADGTLIRESTLKARVAG